MLPQKTCDNVEVPKIYFIKNKILITPLCCCCCCPELSLQMIRGMYCIVKTFSETPCKQFSPFFC